MLSLKSLWDAAPWKRRKRTGEALAHLAAIVESSDDAILSKDLRGVVQSCNAAAERIFGYPASELVGRPITILIPPERLSEEVEILGRLVRGERIEHFETVRVAKDGRLVDVSLTISPIRDASGRVTGASKVARDITDRKRADAALRRAQQVARFLANASVVLTDLSDSRSILLKAGSLSVPFFADWCAVDVLREDGGLDRLVVTHHEPRKADLAHEIAGRWLPLPSDAMGPGWVVHTGRPEIVEDIRDGDVLSWVRDREHGRILAELGFASYISVPVKWLKQPRAALTFAIGGPGRRYDSGDLRVAEDLAHRTGVAVENAVLYRSALEADRRKDDFLAILSHELRTPLNAIVGWSQILREGPTEPDILKKALDTIHRNAQVQTQLISDLLDISRISTGKMRLDVRAVDLKAVIDAAIDALRPAAAARSVQIDTVLDEEAGPLSGDPGRLQQVVGNLVANAIKFVLPGGRVRVRTEAAGDRVRLSVEDDGPGVDPAFLPYAFEPFRQAEAGLHRRYQGLGLGLAIVRQLVELHGGTVWAANGTGGIGAIFTVELPRRSTARAVTVTERAVQPLHVEQPMWLETAPSLQGVRVLVVDDQEDARDLLQAVLKRCGAEVVVAASASEALAILPVEKPHVMLSDVEMPNESGYDLLRRLRALPPERGGETPAVALTAYATADDRVKVLRAGFQMHVSKPVQPAELATVLATLARKGG